MNTFENNPTQIPGANLCPWRPMGFAGTARTSAATAISAKVDVYGQSGPQPQEDGASSGAADTFVKPTNFARQMGFRFMGTGADNSTFSGTIWGWSPCEWVKGYAGHNKAPIRWVATPLYTFTGILGTKTVQDVDDEPLSVRINGGTWRFADTIAVGTDYTYGGTGTILASGLNSWASLYLDPCNAAIIEVEAVCGTATRIMPWWARV